MEIKIKPLNILHLDDLIAVENDAFSTPWSREGFEKEIENELAYYWVALVDNKVIGYMGMWYIIDEGHITNIAVHSDYRGQGIGKKILEHGITKAVEKGIDAITLEVRPSNKAAISLYEQFGFEVVGRRRDYYEKPIEDGFVFWLKIKEVNSSNA